MSAPAFYLGPELGEAAELCAAADVDVDLFLERVGIVGGLANVFDVIPELFEAFPAVVEDNHTIAGIAARSPQEPGLMAAERCRQAVAAAEEVDGAGLAVVLGEDAAVFAVFDRDAVPGDGGFGDDFFPSELVGIPLREKNPGVTVFGDRRLEGKTFEIGNESIDGENGHDLGSGVRACSEQNDNDEGCQRRFPPAARLALFLGNEERFDYDCSCGQQHGIDRAQVVILSVENKEGGEANQVAPAEYAVRFDTCGKEQRK